MHCLKFFVTVEKWHNSGPTYNCKLGRTCVTAVVWGTLAYITVCGLGHTCSYLYVVWQLHTYLYVVWRTPAHQHALLGSLFDIFLQNEVSFTLASFLAVTFVNIFCYDCSLAFNSQTILCFSWRLDLTYLAPCLVSKWWRKLYSFITTHNTEDLAVCLLDAQTHSISHIL